MIVRDEGDTFLLITQPDHARLAEQIGAAMRTEPALETADRDAILLAHASTTTAGSKWMRSRPSNPEQGGRATS